MPDNILAVYVVWAAFVIGVFAFALLLYRRLRGPKIETPPHVHCWHVIDGSEHREPVARCQAAEKNTEQVWTDKCCGCGKTRELRLASVTENKHA